MPELPPPSIPENTSERASQALTPEAISAVLNDFRAWLAALAAEEQRAGSTRDGGPSVAYAAGSMSPAPDLHTLLGQFLAVRHEVNLQTRAVRAQQEQNAETLRQLAAALDALRQFQARGDETQQRVIEEAIRPLLHTLIDLYDALALASREMQRFQDTLLPEQGQTDTAPDAPLSPSRLLFRSLHRFFNWKKEEEQKGQKERLRQLLASLVTGYTMSLQRIERALRRHGLEAIATAGERFDPERMEVVEAVANSGRPSGEVIDEVRRGYLWNGRVFRYAQVRVAKG